MSQNQDHYVAFLSDDSSCIRYGVVLGRRADGPYRRHPRLIVDVGERGRNGEVQVRMPRERDCTALPLPLGFRLPAIPVVAPQYPDDVTPIRPSAPAPSQASDSAVASAA